VFLLALCAACVSLLAAHTPHALRADDPTPAIVPDLALLTPPEAAQLLAENGLVLERWFERAYGQGYELGRVIQQKPRPGVIARRGSGVMLMVSAAANGSAEGRPPDPAWAKPSFVPPPALPAPVPPAVPPAVLPPAPVPPAEAPAPAPEAVVRQPVPPSAGGAVSGSPDAPAVAERATPGIVPDLRGLSLTDAEQRAREAELQVYVERVPGHPIGRVVEQIPPAGEKRGKGAVVRVNVTAGGDYDGGIVVPVPAVAVPRVMVPDLLDRTPPQAERILTDLGLAMQFLEAKSGLAGRVVDQKPASGSELPKGGLVTLWVVPDPAGAPLRSPVGPAAPAPAPASSPPAPVAPPSPATGPPASGPTAPPASATGVPVPIAPSEGTALPKQRTLALGFSWQPVESADAYVLEIEERGPGGWLPSVRKPARAAATTVELERIAPQASDVRWRVRAVVAGREGSPCAWVTLP
jgi:beta-lactam-binding protein with PASTA domain